MKIINKKDLRIGMIIRFEYGIKDNWVTGEVVEILKNYFKNGDLVYVHPLSYPGNVYWDVSFDGNEKIELISA